MLLEDPEKGIIVSGLSEFEIEDFSSLYELILKGNKHRKLGNTNLNEYSSRSHAILSFSVNKEKITSE